MECKKVITYKSQQGTGSLLRHRCFRERKTHNAQMGYHQPSTTSSTSSKRSSSSAVPKLSATTTTTTPTASLARPVNLTISRRSDDKYKTELHTLLCKNDPSVEVRHPERTGFVWDYNNFKIIYRNGMKQSYVLCTLCIELIPFQSRTGTSRLTRHKCFTELRDLQYGCNIDVIEKLLAQADPSVSCHAHANPLLADRMHTIYRNGEKTEYLLCRICNRVLRDGALSRLMEHRCRPESEKSETIAGPALTFETPPSPPASLPIEAPSSIDCSVASPNETFKDIGTAQMQFVGECMIPPDILQREAYHRLVQFWVNIGSQCGAINIRDLALDKDQFLAERDLMVATIKQKIQTIVSTYQLAYSVDIWEDLNRRKTYMTLMGHYIDETFKMRKCCIGIRPIDQSEKMLLEDIVTANILEMLQSYADKDIAAFISNLVFVVNMPDGGTLERFTTINCSALQLKRIVEELLDDPLLEVAKVCLEIAKLPASITAADLLSWSYVTGLLTTPGMDCEGHRKRGSMQKAEAIQKLLQPFQQASSCLSCGDGVPTINQVYVFRKKLEDICGLSYFNETSSMKQLKSKAIVLVKERFVLSDLHKLAVFLDPRFKSLKFMEESERAAVISMTKRLIAGNVADRTKKVIKLDVDDSEYSIEFMEEDSSATTPAPSASNPTPTPTDEKSQYLMEYMDDPIRPDVSSNEVDIYLNAKLTNAMETDVLEFWSNRKDLDRLRLLARTILCIPACSSAAASIFSNEAVEHAKSRLNLDFDDLEAAILINGNC